MFTALCHTGKVINPHVIGQHVIKAKVNGAATPFTLANNEQCTFGLFDRANNFIGYLQRRGITLNRSLAASMNGKFDILVNDAPEGTHVKKLESFYLN